jgi:hypothetical protein
VVVLLVLPPFWLCLQCDKVAIVKDSAVVYFGPYDAAAINTHMPMDHMLADATVEAKDSAAAPAEGKVSTGSGFVMQENWYEQVPTSIEARGCEASETHDQLHRMFVAQYSSSVSIDTTHGCMYACCQLFKSACVFAVAVCRVTTMMTRLG